MKNIFLWSTVLIISIALIGVFSLTGCQGEVTSEEEAVEEVSEEAEEEAAPAEKIKLNFLSHTYEPWNNKLIEQADAFMEENPNIEIEYSYVMHEDLYTKIISSLEGGTGADIIGAYGPWVPQMVSGNFCAVAPDDVAEDIENNYGRFEKDAVTFDGKIVSYIQHIGIRVPIVNPVFFEEIGEEIPETWSGWAELSEKYADRDDIAITALAPDRPHIFLDWATVLRCYGVETISDDLTKATFNTPEGIEATKTFLKLADPDFPTTDANSVFLLGRAGMVSDGPWSKSFYEESEVLEEYNTTIPPKEKERWLSAYVWNWVVNANSSPEAQRAAWDFNKYISNDENYLDMAQTVGFAPIRNTNKDILSEDPWIKGFVDSLDYSFIYYARINNWEEVEKLVSIELERVVAGEISAEEALANAEEVTNKALSQ
jgi:ABC-type glycerol-3-phosphate transport system substrate-binding protein